MRLILPIALFAFLLSGCIKEYENYTSYEKSIGSFFDKTQTLELQFSFDAADGKQYVTDKNTILTIPEYAFVDDSGELVFGQIDFTFLDIIDKSVIMLYEKPTVSNGELLESAGVFYLEAKKDGKNVYLNQNIRIQVPSDNPNAMLLFEGEEIEGEFNWEEMTDDTSSVWRSEWNIPGSQFSDSGFTLEFDRLSWINCDRFVQDPGVELTKLCVDLPEEYTNANTISYLVFEDLNSVINLYGDASLEKFCYRNDRAPIGYKVSFVVIHVKDEDQYELGIAREVVIQKNHAQEVVMEAHSLEQILDILAEF